MSEQELANIIFAVATLLALTLLIVFFLWSTLRDIILLSKAKKEAKESKQANTYSIDSSGVVRRSDNE